MRLFALRGATTVDRNEPDAISDATEALMREIMERNALGPDDVVSCIFTLTNDLDAEFPAVAARKLGFDRVPLLCAREVPVPGSLPLVIRVLIHYYADDGHEAQPRLPRRGAARCATTSRPRSSAAGRDGRSSSPSASGASRSTPPPTRTPSPRTSR